MDIGQLIANPQQDLSPHKDLLKALVEKNSFCATTMMLYLKALKDTNSIDFEGQLKKTAILCQDRSVLFEFIKKTTSRSATDVIEDTSKVGEQNESSETTKDQHDRAIKDDKKIQTDDVTVSENKEAHTEEPENEKTEVDGSVFELNQDIYARAVHASIHNEEDEQEQNEQENSIDETPVKQEESTIEKEDEVKSIEPVQDKAESEVQLTKEKLSFIDWLKAQKNNQESSEPINIDKEEQKEQPEKEEKTSKKETQIDNSHRSEINLIVDQFIKEEPTITRKRAEFFSPSETAKKSIKEDEKIVTETLAEIYLKQGNYKKAIEAYEQLILKFPKKKSFFADRIEFIKNKRQ